MVESQDILYKTKEGGVIPIQLSFGFDTDSQNQNEPAATRKLNNDEFSIVENSFTEDKNFIFSAVNKITSYQDAAFIFRKLEQSAIENAFALYIDKNGKPTVHHISMGNLFSTTINYQAIAYGISVSNCSEFYFVHNHPSGNLIPSSEDKILINKLKETYGDIVKGGIIIDIDSGYFSVFNEESFYAQFEFTNDYPTKTLSDLKVLKFDKQTFNRNINQIKIESSSDAASLVASIRLSSADKLSALFLSRSNKINANIHFNYSSIEDENLLKDILIYSGRFNSNSVLIYGRNNEYSRSPIMSLKESLSKFAINLFDVINFKTSPEIYVNIDENLINTYSSRAALGLMEPMVINLPRSGVHYEYEYKYAIKAAEDLYTNQVMESAVQLDLFTQSIPQSFYSKEVVNSSDLMSLLYSGRIFDEISSGKFSAANVKSLLIEQNLWDNNNVNVQKIQSIIDKNVVKSQIIVDNIKQKISNPVISVSVKHNPLRYFEDTPQDILNTFDGNYYSWDYTLPNGSSINVKWNPAWMNTKISTGINHVQHLEFRGKEISETGFKSHFIQSSPFTSFNEGYKYANQIVIELASENINIKDTQANLFNEYETLNKLLPSKIFSNQYFNLREKYPDVLLLLSYEENYFAFSDDAKTLKSLIGVETDKNNEGLLFAYFPTIQLEIHLRKLVQNNIKVAIVDELKLTPEKHARESLNQVNPNLSNILGTVNEINNDIALNNIQKGLAYYLIQKHTISKKDLHTIKLSEIIDYNIFKELEIHAKTLNGYFSKYHTKDVKTGFIFPNEDLAKQFLNYISSLPSLTHDNEQSITAFFDRVEKDDILSIVTDIKDFPHYTFNGETGVFTFNNETDREKAFELINKYEELEKFYQKESVFNNEYILEKFGNGEKEKKYPVTIWYLKEKDKYFVEGGISTTSSKTIITESENENFTLFGLTQITKSEAYQYTERATLFNNVVDAPKNIENELKEKLFELGFDVTKYEYGLVVSKESLKDKYFEVRFNKHFSSSDKSVLILQEPDVIEVGLIKDINVDTDANIKHIVSLIERVSHELISDLQTPHKASFEKSIEQSIPSPSIFNQPMDLLGDAKLPEMQSFDEFYKSLSPNKELLPEEKLNEILAEAIKEYVPGMNKILITSFGDYGFSGDYMLIRNLDGKSEIQRLGLTNGFETLHKINRRAEEILYKDFTYGRVQIELIYKEQMINAGMQNKMYHNADPIVVFPLERAEKMYVTYIENAIEYGDYEKYINEGRMTVSDVKSIAEQAGIDVPRFVNEILERHSNLPEHDGKEYNVSQIVENTIASHNNMDLLVEIHNQSLNIEKKNEAITDFGEKIGGARKDNAERGYTMSSSKEKDDRPVWRRRYDILENTDGKYTVVYTDPKAKYNQSRFLKETFLSKNEAEKSIPVFEVLRTHRILNHKDNSKENLSFGIYKIFSNNKFFCVKGGFATLDEASHYLYSNPLEIIDFKYEFPSRPHLDKIERTGVEYRDGDVSPELFQKTFGFRGGEFGNWLPNDERQSVLNFAYDALMDLSNVLNVPPKALSLNGDIAVAFGSRGHGLSNATAHYERDRTVFNLTRIKGAGAVAHEWFHAFDHYLARLDGKANNVRGEEGKFIIRSKETDYASYSNSFKPKLRTELYQALKDTIETTFKRLSIVEIDLTFYQKRTNSCRDNLNEALANVKNYLIRDDSMYSGKKPANREQIIKFEIIAGRILDLDLGEYTFIHSKSARKISYNGSYCYNTVYELSGLCKEVKNKSQFNSDGNGLINSLSNYARRYKESVEQLDKYKLDNKEERKVNTTYFNNSKEIDEHRASSYWATNHEMAARAFEAFVQDKIYQKGLRSDYLVYGAANEYYLMSNPYPEGDERKQINSAFEKLFSIIQVKEENNKSMIFEPNTQYKTSKNKNFNI